MERERERKVNCDVSGQLFTALGIHFGAVPTALPGSRPTGCRGQARQRPPEDTVLEPVSRGSAMWRVGRPAWAVGSRRSLDAGVEVSRGSTEDHTPRDFFKLRR